MDHSLRQRSRAVLPTASTSSNSFLDDADIGRKRSPPLIYNQGWLLIFAIFSVIFSIVLYSDVVRLPTPLTINSLKISSDSRSFKFSEERARNFVDELTSIGSKPTGSHENEVIAVDYLMRQLNYIKSHAKPMNNIVLDIQKTSGCFPLTFKDGMTSCYDDVKNVIAKIGPVNPTNRSILVNCHFDSVPTSPGASDDIVSCAIMLEVLLSLSQHNKPLDNEVIFLFNGAEENILQAAHGFITQHPMAKSVVGFINLEACGAGGKQMLFQAHQEQTWLLQAYAKGAPFPHGSGVAQDIFQSGLIPSDTDYRIFEHFGGLPGLDFAYVKNGYVYHTKFDIPEFITAGAIQQAGDNLLNLLHNALQSPDMVKPEHQTKLRLVYFDFLGLFMVVYPLSVATVINIILIIISCIDIVLKSKRSGMTIPFRISSIIKAHIFMVISLIAACIVCGIIAAVLNVFGATMSWYRSPFLIVGLYGCSSFSAILAVHAYTANNNEAQREKWLEEDIYFDASRMLWTILLVITELARLNCSFICCAWILFPTLIRSIIGSIFNLTSFKGTRESHLFIHLAMQVIPLSLLFYCVWSMYTVFVPIMGRIGAMINPDLLVGLFTTIYVFLATSYMFSLVQVMAVVRKVIFLLSGICAVTIALVCFTPLGFPYSGDPSSPAPMRGYILHTERTFYNISGKADAQDSGYWVVPLDYNGPKELAKYIPNLKNVQPINCDEELACGVPFYMPVISLLRKSFYIPASKPKIHSQRKFELSSKSLVRTNSYRLSFKVTGPDHMTFVLSPRPGVELSGWSLTEDPLRSLDWKNRPTYFVYYSYGEYTKPWLFTIDLQVPKQHTKDSPLIDVIFITHHLHGHDSITGDFPNLLNQIPSWIHITPWTCTLDMFVF